MQHNHTTTTTPHKTNTSTMTGPQHQDSFSFHQLLAASSFELVSDHARTHCPPPPLTAASPASSSSSSCSSSRRRSRKQMTTSTRTGSNKDKDSAPHKPPHCTVEVCRWDSCYSTKKSLDRLSLSLPPQAPWNPLLSRAPTRRIPANVPRTTRQRPIRATTLEIIDLALNEAEVF